MDNVGGCDGTVTGDCDNAGGTECEGRLFVGGDRLMLGRLFGEGTGSDSECRLAFFRGLPRGALGGAAGSVGGGISGSLSSLDGVGRGASGGGVIADSSV